MFANFHKLGILNKCFIYENFNFHKNKLILIRVNTKISNELNLKA